jgi:carbonic anhydrase
MKPAMIGAFVAAALGTIVTAADDGVPSADVVLRELKAGNDHHVAKRYQHPHQTATRQRELASAQTPHAIILSCADSRVAPEIILDQGLGDLFDVRVAGNVAADAELASIEYAASHLHTPLLVVMGHQKCGAVTAAAESGEAEGHLPTLLALIRPAIERAKGQPGDLIDNAVRINVENVVRQVHGSAPPLASLVDRGALRVVGAVYSLDTVRLAGCRRVRRTRTLGSRGRASRFSVSEAKSRQPTD